MSFNLKLKELIYSVTIHPAVISLSKIHQLNHRFKVKLFANNIKKIRAMRRIILSLTVLVGFALSVNAQELGVRFGNVTGGDVALDAVFSAGEFSRIHANVSFGNDIVGIDALLLKICYYIGGYVGKHLIDIESFFCTCLEEA